MALPGTPDTYKVLQKSRKRQDKSTLVCVNKLGLINCYGNMKQKQETMAIKEKVAKQQQQSTIIPITMRVLKVN